MKKILISPGFGAGWSTWNSGEARKIMLTYQPIIDFLERGGKFKDEDTAENSLHPLFLLLKKEVLLKTGEDHVCVLGGDGLVVETAHGPFRVIEYDGNEHVEYKDEIGWDE